jgi:hypothetical protein
MGEYSKGSQYDSGRCQKDFPVHKTWFKWIVPTLVKVFSIPFSILDVPGDEIPAWLVRRSNGRPYKKVIRSLN